MFANPSVYVLRANENWITDVHVDDFVSRTSLPVAATPESADIVWLHAGWCWRHISPKTLAEKKVVCTVHHIVPEKFNAAEFAERDRFVDVYFVYTFETAKFIRAHSKRPIARIAHWVDPDRWCVTDRSEARYRLGIPQGSFVVGSFQRDTEGSDLTSPKLEKGPDVLCDVIERLNAHKKVTVLLGGWRREYVLNRLERAGISTVYLHLPPQEVVKDMYASCDLYLCTARREGGPMCLLEASIMRVPLLSTRVGISEDVLHPSQIFDPASWDFSLPSQDAIDHSYRRAAERDPRSIIIMYDSAFRQIHSQEPQRAR